MLLLQGVDNVRELSYELSISNNVSNWSRIGLGHGSRILQPDLKMESLDTGGSADEIMEYSDRLNFWIDTRKTSDEKAVEGAFLTAVGKEALTLLNTFDLSPNLKARFRRRNLRGTFAPCRACRVQTGRTGEIARTDAKS